MSILSQVYRAQGHAEMLKLIKRIMVIISCITLITGGIIFTVSIFQENINLLHIGFIIIIASAGLNLLTVFVKKIVYYSFPKGLLIGLIWLVVIAACMIAVTICLRYINVLNSFLIERLGETIKNGVFEKCLWEYALSIGSIPSIIFAIIL